MTNYSDYLYIKQDKNFLTGSGVVGGTGDILSLYDGKYTFTYHFLNTRSELSWANGYDVITSGENQNNHSAQNIEYGLFVGGNNAFIEQGLEQAMGLGAYDPYSVLFTDVSTAIAFQYDVNADTANINIGKITYPLSGASAYAKEGYNPDEGQAGASTDYSTNYNDVNKKYHGDIWVNMNWQGNWNQSSVLGSYEFNTLLHELGHSLGLEHTFNPITNASDPIDNMKYSIMSYTPYSEMHHFIDNTYTYPSGLQLFDIAAIQEIYKHRNYTTRASDTAYTIENMNQSQDDDNPFMYTIWDGGGVDKIDASSMTIAAQIDLRQGHFSSIGYDGWGGIINWDSYASSSDTDPGNVAIAYHTVIENAVGTGLADILIGNDWGNRLEGGGGADYLYGDGFIYNSDHGFTATDSTDPDDPNLTRPVSDDDIFYAGTGEDTVFGGFGNDTFYAEISAAGLEEDLYHGGGFVGGDSTQNAISYTMDGTDTLNYSDVGFGVTLKWDDLGDREGVVYKSTDAEASAVKDNFVSIENFVLTSEQDTVQFSEMPAYEITLDGSESTDILDFSESTTGVVLQADLGIVGDVNFSNFEHFIGSNTGADHFFGGAITAKYDGRGGIDAIDYSQFQLSRVSVNVAKGEIEKFASAVDKLHRIDLIENIEIISGTNGNDFFRNKEGTGNIVLDGAGQSAGRDIIDFSHYTLGGIGVNLETGTSLDSTLASSSILNFEQVIGTGFVDSITGGLAGDWLFGGGGNDAIEGGIGSDHIVGGEGQDTLSGGADSDTYHYSTAGQFWTNQSTDLISDSSGFADRLFLGGNYAFSGDGMGVRTGSAITFANIATIANASDIEFIEFSDGVKFRIENLGHTVPTYLIENFVGGATNGNDNLIGTSQNDLFQGFLGADILSGGAGFDIASYEFSSAAVTIRLAEPSQAGEAFGGHAEGDTLTDIEGVIGSDYNDTFIGNFENNKYIGGFGYDTVSGGAGDDVLIGRGQLNGEEGNDWIYGEGGGVLLGEEGSDHLYTNGNDVVFGGEGEDFLFGGNGAVLDGGSGNDFLDGDGASNVTYIAGTGIDAILNTGSGGRLIIDNGLPIKYEHAENGSLIISMSDTDKVVILNYFSGNALDSVSFDNGASFHAFPTSGISFKLNEFDNAIIGSSGNNDYIADDSGSENTVIAAGGNNNYFFNSTYNGKTTVGSIGTGTETIILEDAVSPSEVSLFRYSDSPTDVSLFYGTGKIVLSGAATPDFSDNFTIKIGTAGQQLSLQNIGITTIGTTGNDTDDNPFSLFGTIEGDVGGFTINDTMYGGNGNDALEGKTGDDFLYGEQGNDELLGGDGVDTLDGGEGDDEIDGGNGNDILIDTAGNDIYHAGAGDVLTVGSGDNTVLSQTDLSGFTIDLSAYGTVNQIGQITDYGFFRDFSGNSGSDYKLVYGGNSLSLNSYTNVDFSPQIKLINGSFAYLSNLAITGYGSENADSYSEQNFISQNDLVYARGGDDHFTFMDGNDVFYGGDGNDNASKIFGFSIIINGVQYGTPSGTGNLTAYGEGGDDLLQGGIGNDTLNGGDGNDAIYDLWGGTDTLIGGAGDDVFLLDADGDDTVDGGDGSDTVILSAANTLSTIDGSALSSFEIDLSQGTVTSSLGAVHDLISIENAVGSERDDTILGSNADNRIGGDGGDDDLQGGLGNDSYLFDVVTDSSNNPINSGDDIIYDLGGTADNLILNHIQSTSELEITQDGLDMLVSFEDGSVRIVNQFLSSAYHIENLILADETSYDLVNYTSWYVEPLPVIPTTPPVAQNTFTGTGTFNFFIGSNSVFDAVNYSFSTAGVNVNLQTNVVSGGYAANDFLSSIEMVTGSNLTALGDTLYGNLVANVINGLAGNDILSGGGGDDFLYGGAGNDTYLFNLGDGIDVISDTSGFDILSLGAGIAPEDITYTRINNDLYIKIGSGFLVQNFYSGNPDALVEQISFANGSTFDLTTLLVPPNTAPTAQNDVFVADQDTAVTGNLLADNGNGADSDPDAGDILSVLAQTLTTAHGSVVISANGDFTYTPTAGYVGTDSFDYTLLDALAETDTASVSLSLLSNADTFTATSASENFDGGTGVDTVDYSDSPTAISIDLKNGVISGGYAAGDTLVSIENIIGSDPNNTNIRDYIWGNDQNNAIYGLSGNDILEGGAGADTIDGGTGWDYARYLRSTSGISVNLATNVNTGGDAEGDLLYGIEAVVGTAYNDTIIGGTGNDYLKGEAGNDYLYGGSGFDQLYGDAGNDTYLFTSGTGVVSETSGVDRLIFDLMWSPEDVIINDNFLSFLGSAHNITFNDVTLIEEFQFDGYAVMNLATLQAYNPPANTTGDEDDNIFYATTSAEDFSGLEGIDTVDYSASLIGVKVDLQAGTGTQGDAAGDTYTSIENVTGSNIYHVTGSDTSMERDTIYGNASSNHIRGLAGNDILEGGGGADLIDGGDGWDYARYTRSDAGVSINMLTNVNTGGHAEGDSLTNIEAVTGSSHNDTIIGGNGADYLTGGAGNDFLSGGAGVDDLFGSDGADIFWFDPANAFSNIDKIRDFSTAQNDKIDIADLLSGYDPLTDAITDFIEITDNGTHSFLKIDIDGGANNFVQIAQISNVIGLTNEEALETSGHLVTV